MPRQGRTAAELDKMVEKAMKHPGVAEAVRIYNEYQKLLSQVTPSLRIANTPMSFSTTDSKSY